MMRPLLSIPCCRSLKIRLAGSVGGIDSCELITDKSALSVGSSIACDLTVADPLVPARAFTIRRAAAAACPPGVRGAPAWTIEAAPGARLYVNDALTRREALAHGDRIRCGCHSFVFDGASGQARNFRSNTMVSDVCNHLLAEAGMPAGYLHGTPQWLARQRMRTATRTAAAIAALIALVLVLTPRNRLFEQIQPPIQVVMISDRALTPDPTAVRSMNDVQRRTVAEPVESIPAPELAGTPPPAPPAGVEPVAEPLPDLANVRQPDSTLRATTASAGDLDPLPVETPAGAPLAISAPARQMARQAPARRLSIKEATDPVFARELASRQIEIAPDAIRPLAAVQMAGLARDHVRPPPTNVVLRTDPAQVAALMKYEASPLTFDQVSGHRVPVARLPGKLGEMEIKGADTVITLDGTVSEEEIAVSWKSGQFRLTAQGNPPPYGNPPTYCYVGKADLNGRPHLYISFVCMDPNVGGILNAYTGGAWERQPKITYDDSVEIFLDVNFNRTDYYQLIVNTAGKYWGMYCSSWRATFEGGGGRPWDPRPNIKTTVNRAAGRWDCEIMIPFDQLGGVPAKGARWSVNFTRNYRGQHASGHNLQNWFTVYSESDPNRVGHFLHKPELFGVFQW
jgi:hypothetical protein